MIKTAKSMGVNVKMITGDHVAIAKEIAHSVDMGTTIELASAIIDNPDEEVGGIIENADGFAQVFPEHKYKIVDVLQSRGHIVGMTASMTHSPSRRLRPESLYLERQMPLNLLLQ